MSRRTKTHGSLEVSIRNLFTHILTTLYKGEVDEKCFLKNSLECTCLLNSVIELTGLINSNRRLSNLYVSAKRI